MVGAASQSKPKKKSALDLVSEAYDAVWGDEEEDTDGDDARIRNGNQHGYSPLRRDHTHPTSFTNHGDRLVGHVANTVISRAQFTVALKNEAAVDSGSVAVEDAREKAGMVGESAASTAERSDGIGGDGDEDDVDEENEPRHPAPVAVEDDHESAPASPTSTGGVVVGLSLIHI